MAIALPVDAFVSNCVCIEDVTPSKYPISVDVTVPIDVADGSVTVPVNVGDAVGAYAGVVHSSPVAVAELADRS
jgi:hypothetical protein